MTGLMLSIYRANMRTEKVEHILKAREYIEVVKLQVRLLHDLKQLPVRNMAKITLHYEAISKQLAAWHKATNKKTI